MQSHTNNKFDEDFPVVHVVELYLSNRMSNLNETCRRINGREWIVGSNLQCVYKVYISQQKTRKNLDFKIPLV